PPQPHPFPTRRSSDLAGENARRLGLSDCSEYHQGHLFGPVADVEADVVIGDVSGIPDAIAEVTPWTSGGPTGAELPIEMLETLGDRKSTRLNSSHRTI